MTDTQILTLALSGAFSALAIAGSISALLYSNKRVDDPGKRFDGFHGRLDDFEKRINEKIDAALEHVGTAAQVA